MVLFGKLPDQRLILFFRLGVGYFIFTSLLFIFMYSRNLKWLK